MAIIYPSINTSNFATNGSNTFNGDQSINGKINLTGSVVNGNTKPPRPAKQKKVKIIQ